MTPNQLRSRYLSFFVTKGHAVVPSASLVPENDPSTLFTGSGMQPMVPYLLGAPHPKGTRIVDSQKCFRSQDIEEVGDNRHTTFFEMLGNWSLGDYFKTEQLRWFFSFLTQELGLDPEKLFVTVFAGREDIAIPEDSDSVRIWKELFAEVGIQAQDVKNAARDGMQNGRIFYYSAKENWWSRAGVPENMPSGEPGGPDSEVFYDFGSERQLHENSLFATKPCHVNCDCGRFLEIGNSVFMEYSKVQDGFERLPKKNVDFGGGFERLLAVMHGDPDVFMTPLFTPIITQLEKTSGQSYQASEEVRRSFRVIADHIRAAVVLAADGVFPSNKEQGYFSRRLVRRAIRYAKMIDIQKPFLAELIEVIIALYEEPYPEMSAKKADILQVLVGEEQKFHQTLERGLKELEKEPQLTGEVAFKLYETYGFPFELTQEIAREQGQDIDESEFIAAKTKHAAASRSASAGKFKGGLQDVSEQTTRYHTATHLLHAALRKVLGTEVGQKGSNITGERLRFDFTFHRAVTPEELAEVEFLVNEWITQSLPVHVESISKTTALEAGALAFFVEKYPDEVTVYTIGTDTQSDWISKELCGGPHVQNTTEIGSLKLSREQSAGSGIRRVYGV